MYNFTGICITIIQEVFRQRRLVLGPKQLQSLLHRREKLMSDAATMIQIRWRRFAQMREKMRTDAAERVAWAISTLVDELGQQRRHFDSNCDSLWHRIANEISVQERRTKGGL
jgi:hypothetical protein